MRWFNQNWVGFLISLSTLLVSVIGLIFISRQLVSSENAARAALDTVTSFVDAQRPWLLIEVSGSPNVGFTFSARNAGNSPAKIIWLDPVIPAQLVPMGSSLPKVPPYNPGFHEGGELVNAVWVAPGGKQEIGIFDSFTAHPGYNYELGGYDHGRQRLFIFSAIKYKNTFDDRVHEARFCYRFGSKRLFLDGPPGYNEHT